MKKTTPKLGFRRETLIQLNDLRAAEGGNGNQSRLINTVYYPAPSDLCTRGCPVLA